MAKVWLDCDPGHDDAMAMILGMYGDGLSLLGISTVFGNQTVKLTTLNALKVHYVAGFSIEVPIVSGATKALIRPERTCPEIHGSEGLDTRTKELGSLFPSHEKLYEYGKSKNVLSDRKAIDLMAEIFLSSEEPITLVCTASLTNIALLFSIYPEVKSQIKQIVSMGGSMGIGNTSPTAEWNIEIDPEAASAVYSAGVPFVMVPLNVTHTALVTPDVIERIEALDSKFADLIVDLMLFFKETYKTVFDFDSPPLHDPLAMAYVINPDIFTTRHMNVVIETASQYCDGCTVCDYYETTGRPKNVEVCLSVNLPAFWDILVDCLTKANEKSPLNC